MTVLVNFLLIVGLVGMAAPFVWMLSTSFKGTKDIFRYPPQWIPQEPTLDNYRKLFRTVNIGRPLMNTVITAHPQSHPASARACKAPTFSRLQRFPQR